MRSPGLWMLTLVAIFSRFESPPADERPAPPVWKPIAGNPAEIDTRKGSARC